MRLSILRNPLIITIWAIRAISAITLCLVLGTASVWAMPQADAGANRPVSPVLLSDAGGSEEVRLLLATDPSDKQVYATGAASPKGFYLVPRTAQIAMSRVDEHKADITIPIMAGLAADRTAQSGMKLPSGVDELPLWYLGSRANLILSDDLIRGLRKIGADDPGAQISYTDYSGFPGVIRVQIQDLKSFSPMPIQAAFRSAVKVNKPLFIRLIRTGGRVSDEELTAFVTGMSIEISEITTALRKTEWSFELPDPQTGLVNLGDGLKREIPFYQAFDALDSSLPSLLKSSSPELFRKMNELLQESDWRMSLLRQAYLHYFGVSALSPTDFSLTCGPYRVRARTTAGTGSFVQTAYVPEIGRLTIFLTPWMQPET